MRETQLSSRQILGVFLGIAIVMGGLMAYSFAVLPNYADPKGQKRTALTCGLIAGLAAVWFAKLMIDGIRDRRRGIERGPAKVSGWFNVVFGAVVALGGIACSVLTYWSATSAGGGAWTLYYGMILWGVIQMLFGFRGIGVSRGITDSLSSRIPR